jgi:hypothetical protein
MASVSFLFESACRPVKNEIINVCFMNKHYLLVDVQAMLNLTMKNLVDKKVGKYITKKWEKPTSWRNYIMTWEND